jgi:hypothetical protein
VVVALARRGTGVSNNDDNPSGDVLCVVMKYAGEVVPRVSTRLDPVLGRPVDGNISADRARSGRTAVQQVADAMATRAGFAGRDIHN